MIALCHPVTNKGENAMDRPRFRRAELIISADFQRAANGTVRRLFKFL